MQCFLKCPIVSPDLFSAACSHFREAGLGEDRGARIGAFTLFEVLYVARHAPLRVFLYTFISYIRVATYRLASVASMSVQRDVMQMIALFD